MRLMIKYLKTFWYLDLHILLNKSIVKCCFYIHLVYEYQWKNWFNRWVPFYRSKGLLIINSLNFRESFGHKYYLIRLYAFAYCILYFEDPSRTHNWFICLSWDHFLNTSLYNGFIFLHHWINPNMFLEFFFERGWLDQDQSLERCSQLCTS